MSFFQGMATLKAKVKQVPLFLHHSYLRPNIPIDRTGLGNCFIVIHHQNIRLHLRRLSKNRFLKLQVNFKNLWKGKVCVCSLN